MVGRYEGNIAVGVSGWYSGVLVVVEVNLM